MRNKIKMMICFVLGSIITGTLVYAAGGLTARNIGYSDTTVKDKLDDLYKKADRQNIEVKKVCQYQSEGSYGQKGQVGAKYKCQLGAEDSDNNGVIYRYFYILAVNNDNTVDLIMDRNITEGTSYKTMSWYDAIKFFDNSTIAGGLGTSIKSKWVNVLNIDLPKVKDIVNAIGNSSWNESYRNGFNIENGNEKRYLWIRDYLRNCSNCDNELSSAEAGGYWTRDLIVNSEWAWNIRGDGIVDNGMINDISMRGIRPVITLLKSNLYD